MTARVRRGGLLFGACCVQAFRCGVDAFSSPSSSTSPAGGCKRRRRSTALFRSSPGFVGFRGDDAYQRGGYDGGYGGSYDMQGQVADRQSNLSRRDSRSVNEDPRGFDMEGRYSRPPHPSMMAPPHVMQQTRGYDGRIQGGSRNTYQANGGRTFVETDGRPLNVEMEVWEGPNNSPTKVKMYSEDGRSRPMNILTGGGMGVTSVRNVGSMEFPVRAGVSGGYDQGYGAPGGMPYGGGGYGSPQHSMMRGETVQGGSLKTFTLPSNVNAAQVTITSDGLPVNAKVELWGTSTQVKQLAEVYNDNGQTRPFSAIIDVPGGENTIAVRNTGPMEYPIQVAVEPVGGMGMDGMAGGMGGGYGYGGMMDEMEVGYGPPMMPMMGGPLPPPPF